MLNKIGATQWTIGKLMTIVLLVIVLALVMYGVSTKGLNPLIEKAGGMFDSVQLLFGFGEDSDVEGDCGDSYSAEIEGVGSGMITRCKGSCSIKFEEGFSFGSEFNWTSNSLFVKKGSRWEMIFDVIDDLSLVIREREANKILKEDYETYTGDLEDSSFMSSRIIPIYVLVKQRFGEKYFKWENGVWSEEKNNKWEEKEWREDIEGLKKIYLSSKGILGGDVFYRVGNSGATIVSRYFLDDESSVSFEDIRAGKNSYNSLDIFNGNSGQINDVEDFKLFQDWFSSEKEKIIEKQKGLDEELEKLRELLPSESSGDFEGEPYYLSLVRDSNGEGVFYLKTSSESYGLKGEDLKLVEDNRGEWMEICEEFS